MIRIWPVQQAVYGALTGDSTLMALVTGVNDEPDQNQAFPYINIGEATGASEDLLNTSGAQQTVTLHIWDKDAPISRTKQVMDRICIVLHNARLTISGTQAVQCVVEFAEAIRDVDTLHGILRVRIVTFG